MMMEIALFRCIGRLRNQNADTSDAYRAGQGAGHGFLPK